MATRLIATHVCDNCGTPSADELEKFTLAHGRKQRVVEAGTACGCAAKLEALMDKGSPAKITVNGKRRGRPPKSEAAAPKAQVARNERVAIPA